MKDPAFLFYPNDWLGGTLGMSFEEKGAYMELLMLQFNRGHMTSHMIGQAVGQLWDSISCKFVQDDIGNWYNERLDIEKNKRKSFCESRRNNIKGINQFNNNDQTSEVHTSGHMTSHMENENRNVNKDVIEVVKKEPKINFETFWNLYSHKVGSKQKAKKYWDMLPLADQQKVIEGIPAYLLTIREKQYQPHAATFLYQRRWDAEDWTKKIDTGIKIDATGKVQLTSAQAFNLK